MGRLRVDAVDYTDKILHREPHPHTAEMDQRQAENELILSMLGAASTMQKLNEKLDRISLHSDAEQPSPKTRSASNARERPDPSMDQWQSDWTEVLLLERSSLSGMEDSASDSQDHSLLKLSHTSSKFDSAFGSQTDEESASVRSQDLSIEVNQHKRDQSPRFSSHISTHGHPSRSRSRPHPAEADTQSQIKRKKRRHHHHRHRQIQTTSSSDMSPDLQHSHNTGRKDLKTSDHSPLYHTSSAVYIHPETTTRTIKRGGSTTSLCSTASNSSIQSSSSKILSLELSTEDLREMASKPQSKKAVTQSYHESPALKLDAKLQQIYAEVHELSSDTDTANSGASTPVAPRKFQLQTSEVFQRPEVDSVTDAVPHVNAECPLTPEVIVIDPRRDEINQNKAHHGDWKQDKEEDIRTKEKTTGTQCRKKQTKTTAEVDSNPSTPQRSPKGTVFYHESLTPQSSPHRQPHHHLPKRYEVSPLSHNETDSPCRHAPKRRTSILQRLRRRRGSFKTEKRPKRRVPVKRSFSDRITYHIRKGWIDYEEDLEFISNPSRLRRVGRMIERKAGTLHIVQLNRPPSGMYGIYISQSDARPGIFISRFADSNASKFYAGLLSPGDEIVRVNKEDVKEKSVDYVYDMLETLDTVIFTIVPVCSRPDW